jgi:hypothetical protein
VQRLAAALPSAVPTVVDARPVVGAGLALLEQQGAADDAASRPRALERTVPAERRSPVLRRSSFRSHFGAADHPGAAESAT